MFTKEYTSAVDGGEGGGDGEEGGEGDGRKWEDEGLMKWMGREEVEEGVSETKVMLVVSLASS